MREKDHNQEQEIKDLSCRGLIIRLKKKESSLCMQVAVPVRNT